jgi:hypothetical protein
VFTTDRQTRTTDQYFLDSADQIHFFLEAKARGDDGKLKQVYRTLDVKDCHPMVIFRAPMHRIAAPDLCIGYLM